MSASPAQSAAFGDILTGTRLADSERVARGRQKLAEANIAAAIERNLAKAPPLKPEQIARLSGLLNGGAR